MQIRLVTPAPGRSRGGNRVTALRWTRILRGLGHAVTVDTDYTGKQAGGTCTYQPPKASG